MEWEKSGHKITIMECECFCESKSKLLECAGDSGGWAKLGQNTSDRRM